MAIKVKISDSVSTTSSEIAASSTAVKAAYDLAAEAAGRDVGVTSFNGSTGAVTYTAPVTSVNGATGAVTISSVSTATKTTTTPNMIAGRPSGLSFTLPSGGTWAYFYANSEERYAGVSAGGTTLSVDSSGSPYYIAIRKT